MSFITFNQLIKDPLKFQSLVRELSSGFKTPKFQDYTIDTYNETRNFKAITALNGRIPMASSIDVDSGKPLIGTEKPITQVGEMPSFGNKVTFTGKELARIREIERAISEGVVNPKALSDYLFNYLERLSVGPLITVDKLFFESVSNGTSTIAGDVVMSGVPISIDWKLQKGYAGVIWDNAATADGFKDLEDTYKFNRDTYGVIIDKFTMNSNTFEKLQAQASVRDAITSSFTNGSRTEFYNGTPSFDAINNILINGRRIPPIEIQDYMVSNYAVDGASVASTNMAFEDDRVLGVVNGTIGSYMWTPADESRNPDNGVAYQDVNHVLIRVERHRGKITFESELTGIVVPNMNNEIIILVTNATAA